MKTLITLSILCVSSPTFSQSSSRYCPGEEGRTHINKNSPDVGGFISNTVQIDNEEELYLSEKSAICGRSYIHGTNKIEGKVIIHSSTLKGNSISGTVLVKNADLTSAITITGTGTIEGIIRDDLVLTGDMPQEFNINCGISGSLEERIKDCDYISEAPTNNKWKLVMKDKSNAEIWLDQTSGLIWSHTLSRKLFQKDAITACNSPNELTQIENFQWILPTADEYKFSLLSGYNENLNTNESIYWTATPVINSYNRGWVLFKGLWDTKYRLDNIYSDSEQSVRCVAATNPVISYRKCGIEGTIPQRMSDCAKMVQSSIRNYRLVSRDQNQNEVWLDAKNKLLWSEVFPNPMNLHSARKACAKTAIEMGYLPGKWAVPDTTQFKKSFDSDFSYTDSELTRWYWADPNGNSSYGIKYQMDSGSTGAVITEKNYVRCVQQL